MAQAVLATRKSISVLDSSISYLDTGYPAGSRQCVIFLHGNPTAAYLWRNVIPRVQREARCLAPDLIGMGHSGKNPSHSFRFTDHYRYISAWLDVMDLPPKLFFVIHDWGSGLGFQWCFQHKKRVAGIAFMEAMTGAFPSWDFFPEVSKTDFQNLRSAKGDEMTLVNNWFVEDYLPQNVLRDMSQDEMEEYRFPFKTPGESRRPTLTWPRDIPFMDEGPQDVFDIVMAYRAWLEESEDLPKLYIDIEPGLFSPMIRLGTAGWPNLRTVSVRGLHFPQEDSPTEIGDAVCHFVREVTGEKNKAKL